MAVVFTLTTHPADGNEWPGTHDVPGCRHDRTSVTGTFPGGLSFMHSARRVASVVADRALLRLNDNRIAGGGPLANTQPRSPGCCYGPTDSCRWFIASGSYRWEKPI